MEPNPYEASRDSSRPSMATLPVQGLLAALAVGGVAVLVAGAAATVWWLAIATAARWD